MSFSVYNGGAVGGGNVYANSTVIDNSTGCTHSNYFMRTTITSPSGRLAVGETYGLGVSASLSIAGEFGNYTIVTGGTYNCSCVWWTTPHSAEVDKPSWSSGPFPL